MEEVVDMGRMAGPREALHVRRGSGEEGPGGVAEAGCARGCR